MRGVFVSAEFVTPDSESVKVTKLDKTREIINNALSTANRPVLTLSGGKDSLMLLDLCEPYRERLHVVWARTTETFPHMIDFVRRITQHWDFTELVADQAAFFEKKGLPSAIIPVRHRPHEKNPGVLIQSNGYCCRDLQYKPLARHIKEYDADLVLHGQTAEDLRNLKLSFPKMLRPLKHDRIVAPLADWQADEIMDYCQVQGIDLPMQYLSGLPDSLECWNCTVRTDLKRFQWMQQHCPDLAMKLGAMMEMVYGAVLVDYEKHIKPVIDEAERVMAARKRG